MKYRWIYAALLLSMAFMLAACGNNRTGTGNTGINIGYGMANVTQEEPRFDSQLLGVVKEIDSMGMKISLYDVNKKETKLLSYSGGTDIRDRYGQVISMSQVAIGEIVDGYYISGSDKLIKMGISQEAWEYPGVGKFQFNKTKRIMSFSGSQYRYTEDIIVSDGSRLLELMDINSKDELTVKGVEGDIHSILISKGHGYIRLSGYDAFLGGALEVGADVYPAIEDNMLIVVREGKYTVSMKKGDLIGRKSISVAANEEVVVDMSEYYVEPEEIGTIRFLIGPDGADLYIDDQLTEYEEPMELDYGSYNIRVALNGYEDWTGVLKVASSYDTLEINLAPKAAESPKGDNLDGADEDGGSSIGDSDEILPPAATSSPKPVETFRPENESANTVSYDNDHTITIASPTGAQVYVNGTLKGTTPVSFPKMIGSLTITLCREGYMNKSYSVDTADDKKDVTFSLPDLEKSNG